ncbi:hypothetical protein niasHT_032370 [Heterodera trifolii]|uniref:Uncharacterized protein n=1 Tax=Heterodera trifolii TaxID=157864 RepID=A0ABD2HYL4_9BILA
MLRNLQKLNAVTKVARVSLSSVPPAAVPKKLGEGIRKEMFSSGRKRPIGWKASKIGDTETKNWLANGHHQQHHSSSSSSSAEESLPFSSKFNAFFQREMLSKSAVANLPTEQKKDKNQMEMKDDEFIGKENDEQKSLSILVLGPDDFSLEMASDKLMQLITNGSNIVTEIRAEKGTKYSDSFFDKLITAVLHAEPATLPKMTFCTAPTEWTKMFDFVEEFDGAPCRVKFGGANFECAAEHYTTGKSAYTEYLMRREGTEGQFVFRFYYENLDKIEHSSDKYGENKFVKIEIFTRK